MTARVGINLLWLVPGVVGGSEDATTGTLRALAERAVGDLHHTLFVLEPFLDAHPDLARAFETVVMPLSGRARALRVLGESTWLAGAARRHRLDLVHHAGGTVPPVRTAPSVLTIHDLQPFDHPENFSPVKRRYLHLAVGRSARAARLVLTPSDFVTQSVIDRFGLPHDRVVTVRHGVERPAPGTPVDELRARYDLPGPWFLHPAITYPHKNHNVLVRAFPDVLAAHPDATLVLTGGAGPQEGAVMALVARLGLLARVRRTGRIPAADLAGLYDGATALTFPSVYEGFGLPVLEAMARGCAVAASDATALPEVVGSAGRLLAADDVHGWSEVMVELIEDRDERERLRAAGLARAAELTWDRTAQLVIAAHRRALGMAS